jgi:uncharacterized protein (TIGR03085 family)
MSNDLDLRERRELCDLMLELGPDAPTLCGEWTAFDLAAHLVVRERNPLSSPGIIFGGPFESLTDKVMEREKRRGFEAVVERVRSGPWGPLAIPQVRAAVNFVEYTIHHEDLRRPNGLGPRTDRDDLQNAVWSRLQQLAGLSVRKARIGPIAVELQATGPVDGSKVAGKGPERVRVVGPPLELLLFMYGRQASAEVEVSGEQHAVDVVNSAKFGI